MSINITTITNQIKIANDLREATKVNDKLTLPYHKKRQTKFNDFINAYNDKLYEFKNLKVNENFQKTYDKLSAKSNTKETPTNAYGF